MKRDIAIQMDAVESLRPHTDTTLLLGQEATRRGYNVHYYLPGDLTFHRGEITARARPVTFRSGVDDYYTAGDWGRIDLREMQVVLMRQDPPFDMAYITATHLLEMLKPKTLVVNDPFHVRNAPEKLFMFEFPQFVPPTLITRELEAVEKFWQEHQDIVIKPLYGYAGYGVFRIKQGDSNFHALMELLFASMKEPVVVQRYLPEIKQMDKRILVIDGKISAVMGRVPAADDIRANFRAGGSGVKVEPTIRDIEIGETVGAELAKRGILLAGLDVIGEYLTEINVTCPTGLPKSNALYGIAQERLVWDAIEKRLR